MSGTSTPTRSTRATTSGKSTGKSTGKDAPARRNEAGNASSGHYFELVREFPLRHLKSDRELAEAIKTIKALLVRGKLTRGQQDYLDVLTDIVEKYETEHCPMSAVSDGDMLRHLLDARQITQAKLSGDVRIPMSTISEVLHGKKKLTRRQIRSLADYFHVDPAAFPI
jgi:HTH-type transcriptional regulator / antitoxin HigA